MSNADRGKLQLAWPLEAPLNSCPDVERLPRQLSIKKEASDP